VKAQIKETDGYNPKNGTMPKPPKKRRNAKPQKTPKNQLKKCH